MGDDEVIRRLLERFQRSAGEEETSPRSGTEVLVHVVFERDRIEALFDRSAKSVTITTGPLAGQSFATPSGAASAVVRHYRPNVNPNRNGWTFWTVSADGRLLQSLR